MKQAFRIFFRDVKRLSRNVVAILIVIGVCILPSLYAWFNIASNYDPYSNTSQIKIAVANNDRGINTTVTGSLNTGEKILDNLKQNHDLGWVFTDEKHALQGVRSGDYYAAIIIPKDFTDALTKILSGTPRKAQITYYVNEKKNAVAPKITDTGAETLTRQIQESFTLAASQSVAQVVSSSASDIDQKFRNADDNLITSVETIRDNLKEYEKNLENFRNTLSEASALTEAASSSLNSLTDAAASGKKALSSASLAVQTGQQDLDSLSAQVNHSFSQGESILNEIDSSVSSDLNTLEAKALVINGGLQSGLDNIQEILSLNSQILEDLQQLNQRFPSASIASLLAQLEAEHTNHQEILDSLTLGNTSIENLILLSQDTRTQMHTLLKDGKEDLTDASAAYHETVSPQLSQTVNSLSALSGRMDVVLSGVEPAVQQVDQILVQMNGCLSDTMTLLQNTEDSLSSLTEKLDQICLDLNALKSSELYRELLKIIQLDSTDISDFMTSPVQIETSTFYPMENYGSALAPFYTNLAIWVGGIVLIAIIKLEVDRDHCVSSFSASASYFGRWMLFILLGLIQALVICLGDLYLLKIQCASRSAFILSGLVCSFVYVNIIYALSVTWKHIGKALSILLVILQIPGSAGTYPIEMTPAFFQILHPVLPFTYGVNAMREAIAGIYGTHYIKDLAALLIFVPVFLLLGLKVRPLLLNLNRFFDRKLSETDMMICEKDNGLIRERDSLSMIAQAMVSEKLSPEDLKKNQQLLETQYNKKIHRGFLAMLIIPLIFLAFMFSMNAKMVYLILWILSMIGICVYLICLDYLRDKMRRRFQMQQMKQEELIQLLKERQYPSPAEKEAP